MPGKCRCLLEIIMNTDITSAMTLVFIKRNAHLMGITVLLLMSLLLSGCETVPRGKQMFPGTLISLKDGNEIHFAKEVQYVSGVAEMTANNPRTGETFTGRCSLMGTNGSQTSGTVVNGLDISYVKTTTATTKYVLRGVVKGNKGTVIEICIQIDEGPPLIGTGEAKDNKGGRYQVQYPTGPIFIVPATPAPASTWAN